MEIQMKLMIKIFGVSSIMVLLFSCSDYLDVVPDNTLTIEDLFKQKEEAWDALAKSYSYLPQIDETHTSMWTAGDEWLGRLDLNENTNHLRGIRLMRGVQSVSNPILGCWSGTNAGQPLYEGIRQTNVFLENIDAVPDMSDEEKADWKAQVKFLKAYYSFLLVQRYGPIIISDELIQADATQEQLFLSRSTVEECFDYIIKLMDEAIPDLQERAASTVYGQVDQVIAKAIKARVLVFRASPFFNGNNEYFGDFFNQEGEPFFPLEYDNEKWKDAIDAIEEALVACQMNGVELYTYEKQPYVFDREVIAQNEERIKKLYDLRMVIADPWN